MAKIDLQTAVVKSLVGDQLTPKQLTELMEADQLELIEEHGLELYEVDLIMNFAKKEMYRMRAQGYTFGTYSPEERAEFSYSKPPTRTSPISESKLRKKVQKILKETAGMLPMAGVPSLGPPMSSSPVSTVEQLKEPEWEPDLPPGRNLDYSQNDEGRSIRANLQMIIEEAMELESMIADNDDLPQWCHDKVTQAHVYIDTVWHYLRKKLR